MRSEIENEIIPIKATQEKTRIGSESDTIYAAEHAIDKDLSSKSIAENFEDECWLRLDLDAMFFIEKIVIYSRFYTNYFDQMMCAQSVSKFQTCVDNINNADVSVYEGEVRQKSCGTLQLTYALDLADQIYTLVCEAEGDVVTFSRTTGKISVQEVILFGSRVDNRDIGSMSDSDGLIKLNNKGVRDG